MHAPQLSTTISRLPSIFSIKRKTLLSYNHLEILHQGAIEFFTLHLKDFSSVYKIILAFLLHLILSIYTGILGFI